jgi:hypothetical protein
MRTTDTERELTEERAVSNRNFEETRRTFLKAATAVGAVAGFGGAAVTRSGTAEQTSVSPVQIELGANSPAWRGRLPTDIEGNLNPTLELTVGQTYELTWENTDGHPHELEILDSEGERLVGSTEYVYEEGATETLDFEATEEMTEYRSSTGAHNFAMVGDIQFSNNRGNS